MMPCKTFIMTGGCPYHERCAFLHDPRIRSATSRPKPLRALRQENNSVKDSFYWPDMKVIAHVHAHVCNIVTETVIITLIVDG